MSENRIEELVSLIKHYKKVYWEDNDEEISDSDYDKLIIELSELDPNNPELLIVDGPVVSSDGQIKFDVEMSSLDKRYTFEEFLDWATKVKRSNDEKYKLMPKYDGCSVELKNSIMATKGDGIYGEIVSSKIPITKVLQGGKFTEASEFTGECRGELIIMKSQFAEMNHKLVRKDGTPYKTERNSVGGLLSKTDIDMSLGQILTLVDFEDPLYCVEMTYSELMEFDLEAYARIIKSCDFPTDGLVLKLSDNEYHNSLGRTGHHVKGSMSFKYANPKAESYLRDIEWSVGKLAITPIGIIDPVVISGVTVSRVNLHNMKNILDKDLYINDHVNIQRAGDVIPDLISCKRMHNSTKPDSPVKCPECEYPVKYESPILLCTNPFCIGRLEVCLMDSVVRIGIDELGRPTIRKMIETLGVSSLADILNLTKEDILKLDGFAINSSDKLYNEIKKIKDSGVEEWQILASLNLYGIGKSLSKKLLSQMNLDEIRRISIEDLSTYDNMGNIRATVVVNGLFEHRDYINELTSILDVKQSTKTSMKVCMTGKFPEKKKFYEDMFHGFNIETSGSVSKDTSYLICNEHKGSGKEKRATKLGIPIVSMTEFLNLINVEVS